MSETAKLKVDGSGRRWLVWRWEKYGRRKTAKLFCWNIVAGPYLTKRRANDVMKGMSK